MPGESSSASADPINLFELEAIAKERLPRDVYEYFAGAAGDQITLRANREAFEALTVHYRVLVGVEHRNLSTTVLGRKLAMPILIAPSAFQKLAHPDGEIGVAKAAVEAGVDMVLSTWSNTLLEEVAQVAPDRLWLQLYMYKDRGVTRSLVERAEQAGMRAIVLTVDTPVPGRRESDVRNGFRLPTHLSLVNLEASGLGKESPKGRDGLALYVSQWMDPSLTWKDVEWLRSITRLPLLLKGVIRADDAVRAAEAGCAGIIVSNHGGRQMDGAPATIRVLPEIVDATKGRLEILLDGGVRRGVDVLKALALGARAVLIGRPALWGLAWSGQAGVARTLHLLRTELDLAMALAGCPDVAHLPRDLVR